MKLSETGTLSMIFILYGFEMPWKVVSGIQDTLRNLNYCKFVSQDVDE